jgi:hypothetical protein
VGEENSMAGIGIELRLIMLLTLVAAVIVIGALIARKYGYLRSRTGKLIVIAIVGIIALLLWLGPSLFLVTDR